MPTVAAKKTQAGEIFDRLAELDFGDTEEAMKLLFRIRALDTGYPDPMTKVARADAALIVGHHQEAKEALAPAFRLRSTMELACLQRLALLLTWSGNRQAAMTTARELLDLPGVIVDPSARRNLMSAALWAGDQAFVRDMAAREEAAGLEDPEALPVLAVLEELGIGEHFTNHQLIVGDVLREVQMKAVGSLAPTETGDLIVFTAYSFDGTRTARRSLEAAVEDALDAYYRGRGLDDGFWRGKINAMITEAPRHVGVGTNSGSPIAA